MYKLNNLKARSGIDKKAIGRGIGSGCGKTSGFGHKGGKARSGRGKVSWFEGGQMPLYRRLPKRGFVSRFDKSGIAVVNLFTLQELLDKGVINGETEINIEVLKQAGVIKSKSTIVRLLGSGELKSKLSIVVNYASDAAMKAVESVGGKVQIV